MPSAISQSAGMEPNELDDLDRMLDYENAVEEFLNDMPIRNSNIQSVQDVPKDEDQEVQVKRKRKPVPKLDEERLLSQAGLPRLRKITKSKLRFRGKHHEFSDISKLLNTYQLWLDDLYPRAKFRDGLTILEKLGHTKRMQVMRKAWLDSTKPNRVEYSTAESGAMVEVENLEQVKGSEAGQAEQSAAVNDTNTQKHEGKANRTDEDPDTERSKEPLPEQGRILHASDQPDEDELDLLLAENHHSPPRRKPASGNRMPFEEENEDEDELAVLRERNDEEPAIPISSYGEPRHLDANNDFVDEEEAMVELGGFW